MMRLALGLVAMLMAVAPVAAAEPAYRLRGTDGATITEQAYRGKVQLVFFGFTNCPDVCPTGLAGMARSLSLLAPAERRQVRILFVTVDPARDTMAALREYAGNFAREVVGVTGTPDQIDRMARRFGARHAIDRSDGRYSVSHSGTVYVLDREGRLARRLVSSAKPEMFAATVKVLLKPGH
jgi:protein SCO1/2